MHVRDFIYLIKTRYDQTAETVFESRGFISASTDLEWTIEHCLLPVPLDSQDCYLSVLFYLEDAVGTDISIKDSGVNEVMLLPITKFRVLEVSKTQLERMDQVIDYYCVKMKYLSCVKDVLESKLKP